MTYMVSQFALREERARISHMFRCLDNNNDGVLTSDEFISNLNGFYGNIDQALQEVDKIMSRLNINNSGQVEFSSKPNIDILIVFCRVYGCSH